MQQFKKHIAAIFLAIFLFPQVASSIHYFVVPHEIPNEGSYKIAQTQPDLRFHSCVLHLSVVLMILPLSGAPEFNKITGLLREPNFRNLEKYIHQTEIHFQLRGPPLFDLETENSLLQADKI